MPGAKSLNGISPFLIACPLSDLVACWAIPSPSPLKGCLIPIADTYTLQWIARERRPRPQHMALPPHEKCVLMRGNELELYGAFGSEKNAMALLKMSRSCRSNTFSCCKRRSSTLGSGK